MVRLMLVLAPVMCIIGGIGLSATLMTFMKNMDSVSAHGKHDKKEKERNYPYKNEVHLQDISTSIENSVSNEW